MEVAAGVCESRVQSRECACLSATSSSASEHCLPSLEHSLESSLEWPEHGSKPLPQCHVRLIYSTDNATVDTPAHEYKECLRDYLRDAHACNEYSELVSWRRMPWNRLKIKTLV